MKNTFEIIPAIDILDGKCVRLTQGDYEKKEEFSNNPVEVAKKWEAEGAKRIHVVDLNGAKSGSPINKPLILKIARSVNAEVQVGGGIRTLETIKEYLDSKISYLILGTKAFQDKDFLNEALDFCKKKIIIGLDLKNNRVALSGWSETIDTDFNKLSSELQKIEQIIFTDISKDGMLTGPNIKSIQEVAKSFSSKIIVSGGIGTLNDINAVLNLKKSGFENISGVVIGKSLYKGTINLSSAIDFVKTLH